MSRNLIEPVDKPNVVIPETPTPLDTPITIPASGDPSQGCRSPQMVYAWLPVRIWEMRTLSWRNPLDGVWYGGGYDAFELVSGRWMHRSSNPLDGEQLTDLDYSTTGWTRAILSACPFPIDIPSTAIQHPIGWEVPAVQTYATVTPQPDGYWIPDALPDWKFYLPLQKNLPPTYALFDIEWAVSLRVVNIWAVMERSLPLGTWFWPMMFGGMFLASICCGAAGLSALSLSARLSLFAAAKTITAMEIQKSADRE
jgi:hypothetical protein